MTRRLLILLLFAAVAARAQGPDADWRTIATKHFRIHYPQRYAEWAERAASRIESVREAVVKEVGFDPPQVTDVIVTNPGATANGVTLPLLDAPRIVLFAEAPGPEIEIGEYNDWIGLLTVHEMTHLVHMLRPSRNPLRRALSRVVPLDPITLGAPRWVLEGYATVIEGRITGSGRPNGAFRAAVLRTWAASGQLPTYAQLNGGRSFMGPSMAYLAGSAYLEWLEQRAGAGSLDKVWARMTARQSRTFTQAFEGVFGESPERLYGAFASELTANAVALGKTPRVEGELWQETSRNSGDPALSPDGKRMAIVLRDVKGHAKLVVWDTGENPEVEKTKERIAKILKRDPEDVAPILAKPLPRKALFTLEPIDGGDIETPRWTPDGKSILYAHRQPDREGFLHHDLFLWTPEVGGNRRVTHLADVSDADPLPDGLHAVAVRSRDGFSQLVMVVLQNGDVQPMLRPSLDAVYSHPRASRGGRIVWGEHTSEGWHVVTLDGGRIKSESAFDPEWGPNGELYASVARRGFIDIARLDSSGATPLTRVAGAAMQVAPAPDGSLYFMSLEPFGFVVRKLATPAAAPDAPPANAALVPAVPPQPPKAVALESEAVAPSQAYGIGRQEIEPVVGAQFVNGGSSTEIGLRIGDVIGRLDTLLLGSTGDFRGGALASTWRGWPVSVTLHAFSLRGEHGVEARGGWSAAFPASRVSITAGGLRLNANDRAFVASRTSMRQRDTASESLEVAADSAHHARATARGSATLFGLRTAATVTAARHVSVGGAASSLEPSSLLIERIVDPALRRDAFAGNSYRGARLDVGSDAVTVFVQRHRSGAVTRDVIGIEATLSHQPEPLIKTPTLDLAAGIARVPQERAFRGWLTIRWRP